LTESKHFFFEKKTQETSLHQAPKPAPSGIGGKGSWVAFSNGNARLFRGPLF
jgi:hypothetical protein